MSIYDVEVKWDQATSQLQPGYAKGFHTGRQLQLDIDLSADCVIITP